MSSSTDQDKEREKDGGGATTTTTTNTTTNTTTTSKDHHRNPSMTSVSSSFTPHTASSASLATTPAEIYSPLTTILNKLPSLAQVQQEPINRTLQLINSGPTTAPSQKDPALRLAHSWALYFSDTSNSKFASKSHHPVLKASDYQSGMSKVFSDISDVESLCASLSAFKMTIARGIRDGHLVPPSPHHSANSPAFRKPIGSQKSDADAAAWVDTLIIPGNGLGLIAMKLDQNLHFFRVGVNPVWEDPWNSKGGRLTIQPPLAQLDPTFESIVLLVAGGVLETDAKNMLKAKSSGKHPVKEGGRVVGVVGSRRSRGDRIELWLSGPAMGTSPSEDWIQALQAVLIKEIGLPEVRSAKYKTHYH